jgi:ribosomal protein L17
LEDFWQPCVRREPDIAVLPVAAIAREASIVGQIIKFPRAERGAHWIDKGALEESHREALLQSLKNCLVIRRQIESMLKINAQVERVVDGLADQELKLALHQQGERSLEQLLTALAAISMTFGALQSRLIDGLDST